MTAARELKCDGRGRGCAFEPAERALQCKSCAGAAGARSLARAPLLRFDVPSYNSLRRLMFTCGEQIQEARAPPQPRSAQCSAGATRTAG